MTDFINRLLWKTEPLRGFMIERRSKDPAFREDAKNRLAPHIHLEFSEGVKPAKYITEGLAAFVAEQLGLGDVDGISKMEAVCAGCEVSDTFERDMRDYLKSMADFVLLKGEGVIAVGLRRAGREMLVGRIDQPKPQPTVRQTPTSGMKL